MRAMLFRFGAMCWAGSLLVPAVLHAREDYAGKYEGAKLSVEMSLDGDGYVGEIRLGEQRFPLKAREQAGHLTGTFSSGGESYEFTASRQGNDMTLVTGGATYAVKRLPVNPLARARMTNPAGEEGPGDPLGKYRVVTETDSGRALAGQKKVTSVRGALESVFPDLARYFDARPAIGGAFEDTRDHRSGGASFAAKLKGRPVKGIVSCKLGADAATVTVVYCGADAPAAEWDKLTAGNAVGNGAGAMPDIQLKQYQFPDGTGTIGLADGWTTNAQSCLTTVTLKGPGDQTVDIGLTLSVVTPDSLAVQNQLQMEAQARQMGFRPPPRMQLLVAPFTGPADALKNLVPQISRASEQKGGPAVRLDKITDEQPAKPNMPGGKAAMLSYESTVITEGRQKQYRAVAQIETASFVQGAWIFYGVDLVAPRETFDHDLPAMLAMAKSLHTDDAVVRQRSRENLDAQNRNFAEMQRAHREQVESFDRYNQAWRDRQTSQSRSNADFDEVIRGYRTIEDTRSGERGSANLGDARDIVNKLNEGDPGRYKEIPLRDEMYPLPERGR